MAEDEIQAWIKKAESAEDVEDEKRPSWDEYFAKITYLISKRSTCIHFKQGAIIVRGKRMLTTGYSGAPKDMGHCIEDGCLGEGGKTVLKKWPQRCRGVHGPL